MAKVSVIVPVYNNSAKLERCLESLAKQTLSDIEYILVNDASTDDSYEKMLAFEQKFSEKTIVINCEENQGPGGARNAGLNYASGDYIGFVDSDDYIESDMYEQLYDKAVTGDYDVTDSMLLFLETDTYAPCIDKSLCDKKLSPKERELLILSDGYIVTKLIKRELIENLGVRFRTGVKLEDADFLMKVMLHADKIGAVEKSLYIYDNTEKSGTWSVNKASESEYNHILELMKEDINILNNDPCASPCREAIEGAVLHLYKSAVYCCLSEDGNISEKNLKRMIGARDIARAGVKGGLNNRYFLQVAAEGELELLRFLEGVKI